MAVSETSEVGGPIYGGFRPERQGWIAGLTAGQALTCVAVGLPVVLLFGAGLTGPALVLLPIALVVVAAVAIPVRGRPAAKWATDAMCHVMGVAFGWSAWQSKAAAGRMETPEEPDLPGVCARITMPTGPPFAGHGRVCLIHDSATGRWGLSGKLAYRGVGLASSGDRARYAAGLAELLRGLGQLGVADRVSLLVRTVPDDGTAYGLWRQAHLRADAPAAARLSVEQIAGQVSTRAVRQEAFLTVSAREENIAKLAKQAGGGMEGRARVLYRAVGGLDARLATAGAGPVTWLGPEGLAEAIRTGYNPAAEPALTATRLQQTTNGDPDGGGSHGLPLAAAGPTRAPGPEARVYRHDAYATVSYTLAMPGRGAMFGALAPLLAIPPGGEGERRCVAVHFEILPARTANRIARRERQHATVVRDIKGRQGFGNRAGDAQEASSATSQEAAVAAGRGLVRYAIAAAVTVPAEASVENAAARLEASAANGFPALRLDLAQDAGFASACLPLGIGLPTLRSLG